ncbi:hypothetical protein STPH1_7221 [Streptomyces sp. OM5714]|nr:hypothetical protein STPH1_7221 [Streptomyces sp. OM5714]
MGRVRLWRWTTARWWVVRWSRRWRRGLAGGGWVRGTRWRPLWRRRGLVRWRLCWRGVRVGCWGMRGRLITWVGPAVWCGWMCRRVRVGCCPRWLPRWRRRMRGRWWWVRTGGWWRTVCRGSRSRRPRRTRSWTRRWRAVTGRAERRLLLAPGAEGRSCRRGR